MGSSEAGSGAPPPTLTQLVDQLSVGRQTVGQLVYGVIRQAISSGAFAPGEWLRQESLAETIGVSRIPVRTALMQLESEGLVTFHPHRGARVRTLSRRQIEEIYRLRKLLEPYALQLSMARMTPERLTRIREMAVHLDTMDTGDDFIEARVQFYRQVYDAEHNPLLVEMIEDLRSQVGRYLLGLHFRPERHNGHERLVEFIEDGDLSSGELWLSTHLETVRQQIATLTDDESNQAEAPADEGPKSKINAAAARKARSQAV